MSEQLKEFGAHAETLVEIPDFAEIDRAGRALRVRRRASLAATLAAVVTVAGFTVTHAHKTKADHGPVTPPRPPAGARAFPDSTMKTLHDGQYWVMPAQIQGHSLAQYADQPLVELTLPKGWNSWAGPNKFDGHAPGRSNSEALGHMTWYVGVLALQVTAVNTHGCGSPDVGTVMTAADLTAALERTFAFKQLEAPRQVQKFGDPATHLRVRVTRGIAKCQDTTAVFESAHSGSIQYAGTGWTADIWVVDVDGSPIYVQKIWSPKAPPAARAELTSVIDSIRFSYLK
jgi:uncharacterized protein YfcZ (UPF0381/DUF406 family)